MNIGLFGGTFNPVHNGHLYIAEQAREQCKLDEVVFIPNNIPPHKKIDEIFTPHQRECMVQLAIMDNYNFKLDTREIDKGGVSYAVDTVKFMKLKKPEDTLFFILGLDEYREFDTWKDYKIILQMCKLIIANRARTFSINIDPDDEIWESVEKFIDDDTMDISSTQVRNNIELNKSIRYLVPDSVIEYIRNLKGEQNK